MIAGLGVILLAGVLIPNLPIITYILGGILVVSMQSFLNALAFEYSNTGYRINFGFSRAGGSFSYVVTSFLLGQLLAIYSAAILPILVIVEAVIFFVILHLLPDVKNQEVFPMTKEQDRSVSLRKKYPFLILLFLGFSFLFTFHTMINSFLAQIFENIHGGSKEVGIALMIAALCELPGMIFFEQLVKKEIQQILAVCCQYFICCQRIHDATGQFDPDDGNDASPTSLQFRFVYSSFGLFVQSISGG